MNDFYVGNVRSDYAVFSRKTGAADTVFDTQEEAKIHCDDLNRDLRVKAVAHEMLKALKAVEEWWLEAGMQEIGKFGAPYAMFAARAAIAKAEGRS